MPATPVLPVAPVAAFALGRPRELSAVAWLVVVLSGLVSAAVPRGPVTGTLVLVLVFAATLVGALAGRCLRTRWAIARLQAPVKRVYEFSHSGHNADAEEPGRYNDLLVNTVLPETFKR